MLLKFEELKAAPAKENIIPTSGAPHKSADGTKAVIEYMNFRNDNLAVAVTPEEYNTIEFSKDMKYFKKPEFLKWTTGKKGPYLTHVDGGATNATEIDW